MVKIFKRQYGLYGVNKIVEAILSWTMASPLILLVFGADLWLAIYSVELSKFQIMIKDKTIEQNYYL